MSISEGVKSIPSWVQVLFTVGGLIFGIGILYADVQDIKRGQQRTESVLSQYSQTISQVSSLEIKLAQEAKTNEKIMTTLDKLSGGMEVLSISLARIDERTRKDKGKGNE